MTEYTIAMIVCSVQIVLSIFLIIRQKNVIATLSEIISALVLLLILNGFSIEVTTISWIHIGIVLAQYLLVKLFLICFMLFARIYSFYEVNKLCRKKKKANAIKLKFIRTFHKVKYWPKLKLGLAGKANTIHPKTKVRFDSKGFPKFKSYYTVKLERKDFRKSRDQHFYIANKMLYKNICSNSRIRAKFSKKEIKDFSKGRTPEKYTWHHHQDAGVLQLVEYEIHSKTSHIGGYSIWGEK